MCDGFSEAMVGAAALTSEGVAIEGTATAGLFGAAGEFGLGAGTLFGSGVGSSLALAGSAASAVATSPVVAGIGLAGTLLGGLTQASGAKISAKAQSSAAKYNAQVAANNAEIANQNALIAQQQGAVQVQAQRIKTAQIIGSQRAAMAANGLLIDGGSDDQDSALKIQQSTAILGELDAQTIKTNATLLSRSYTESAKSYAGQSGLLSTQADNALVAGNTQAIGSLLGTAGSLTDKWLSYSRAGVF